MRTPQCPYFGKCGGCATQHLEYELQLANKKKRLAQAIGMEEIQVFSGDEWGYRNRMDMIFTPQGLGFREKGRWANWVDVEQCVISNPKLNALLKEVREYFKGVEIYDLKAAHGTFRYAVIRTPQNDSSISFVLNSDSAHLSEAISTIKAFARLTTANNILVTYMPSATDQSYGDNYLVIKGSDMLKETFLGKEFIYSAQGFFQNNHEMAEKMHEYVHSLLLAHGGPGRGLENAHLLDLYAGVGTFGILNADLFKSVMIVESFAGCIDAANKNIERNNVKNAKALVLDAKQLKNLTLPSPLYVVNDPPRAGMHPKTVEQLIKLAPKAIIYVSCNVIELEKDLKKFLKSYKLKSAALFDLFPQTNHSESVIELVKV
jgi:tRNA (uracil-5-)-methyltransferase